MPTRPQTKTYQARIWTYIGDYTLDTDELSEACSWINKFPEFAVSPTYGYIAKHDEEHGKSFIIARFDPDLGLRPICSSAAPVEKKKIKPKKAILRTAKIKLVAKQG